MIKVTFFILSMFLITSANDKSKDLGNRRKILIEKVANAISRYDTSQLYDLIDTSFCFKIYGKEGFLQKINYAYNRFKMCGNSINDTTITIKHTRVGITEYSIPFVCNASNVNEHGSVFTLLLSFADEQDDRKILFLDTSVKNRIKAVVPIASSR